MNYRQIFIRTEEDYPKSDGEYFCNRSGFMSVQKLFANPAKKSYMREIRWYLEPIPEAKESAEEVLRNNMIESLWEFIGTYPITYDSKVMLKDLITDAMEEYASQFNSKVVMPTEGVGKKKNKPDCNSCIHNEEYSVRGVCLECNYYSNFKRIN